MSNSIEKKEAYKADVASDLARMHDIIMGITPWNQAGTRKGIIVTDDGIHLDSNFAKEHLKYDVLKESGKVNEITIDSTWPLSNELDDKNALWERLVAEAEKVKQGLLVINVCDINLFKHCWSLSNLSNRKSLTSAATSCWCLKIWTGRKILGSLCISKRAATAVSSR